MAKTVKPVLSEEEQKLIEVLKKNNGCVHIKELGYKLDKSSAGIVDLAQKMRDKGIFIWKDGEIFCLGSAAVDFPPEDIPIKENEIKIGIVADTMLGSKYEQLTNLCAAFSIAEHKGVDFMIHLGVSAGKPTAAKKDEFHKLTAEEQVDYIVKNYPASNKFQVRLISGHHDMQWRKEEVNILAEVCARRDDLIYRGDWQSDFPLRRGVEKGKRWPILKAAYHGGDDTPYSKSYPIQGFAQNLIQDVSDLFSDDRPDIVAIAGQGVFCDLSGGIIKHLLSVPGMRLVAPSIMKKKRRSVVPTIGIVILNVRFDKEGKFSLSQKSYPLPGIKNDYREKPSEKTKVVEKLNDDEKTVLELLEKSPRSRGELAQAIDKSDDTVFAVIESLKNAGFNVKEPVSPNSSYKLVAKPKSRFKAPKINFGEYFYETVTEGAVSDTHIGHKLELLEILNEAYDVFEKRGIAKVNHCGDLTNGPPKHDEHYKGETREFRATPLTNDVISLYPRRKNITTFVVSGDHDRWFLDRIGYDILDPVSRLRPDIVRLGIQEGDRQEKRVIVSMRHFNWGTDYAKSHKPQQVVESLLTEIAKDDNFYRDKVICVLSGGGHVYCSMLYKGIVFVLLPCLQAKTGFITGLGKAPDIGFVIFSITCNKEGRLTEFGIEHFDRVAKALAVVREKRALKEALKKSS